MAFVCRMQQQYEEERLQRLVQEEAVKFLWKQVSDWSRHLSFTTHSPRLSQYLCDTLLVPFPPTRVFSFFSKDY